MSDPVKDALALLALLKVVGPRSAPPPRVKTAR